MQRFPALVCVALIACGQRHGAVEDAEPHTPVASSASTPVVETVSTVAVQAPQVSQPLDVGGEVKAPALIHRVDLELPERLTQAGVILLEVIVDKTGGVRDVKLIRDGTQPAQGPAYVEAIKKWRFQPGTRHGEAVDVKMDFTVNIHVR